MSIAKTTIEKIDGIYDIHPPLSPGMSSLEIILLTSGIVICLILLTYFIWRRYFSVKSKIKRKIIQLETLYSERKINHHDAVYQLCSLLQQALKINHIGVNIPLPGKIKSYEHDWNDFAEEVSLIRYSDFEKNDLDINSIFDKSLYWLKVWP